MDGFKYFFTHIKIMPQSNLSLDTLYQRAVDFTLGVAELDKEAGRERTDYGPVHEYAVKAVVDSILTTQELLKEFPSLREGKLI